MIHLLTALMPSRKTVIADKREERVSGPAPDQSPSVQGESHDFDLQAAERWCDEGGQDGPNGTHHIDSMPIVQQHRQASNPRKTVPVRRFGLRMNWYSIFWIGLIHAGVFLAPFSFTWSGLAVCLVLYAVTVSAVNVGFHRLLTHRSFQTPKPVEYMLTVLGCLAGQGGALKWVATHRAHHAHADEEGDPHSPRDGVWWAHMFWWMPFDRILDVVAHRLRYVRDLTKDPVHRFLEYCHVPLSLTLAASLFLLGDAWGGVGLSWLVWGMCVRMTLTYHVTWLVNSATHLWGYRNYMTKDRSTNLWWVALLTFGEGWHNNHHAFPSSAKHGLRWWELDITYSTIRLMALLRLARHVQLPHEQLLKFSKQLGERQSQGRSDAC